MIEKKQLLAFTVVLVLALTAASQLDAAQSDAATGLDVTDVSYSGDTLSVNGNAVPGKVVSMKVYDLDGNLKTVVMDVEPDSTGAFSMNALVHLGSGSYKLSASQSGVSEETQFSVVSLEIKNVAYSDDTLSVNGNAVPGKVVSMKVYDLDGNLKTVVMDVEPDSTGAFSMNALVHLGSGSYKLSASQSGVSVETQFSVSDGTLVSVESIAVTTNPTKMEYTVGESFDSAGMVVTATMSDGTEQDVTGYGISPDRFDISGEQSVTITYDEKITTIRVMVSPENPPSESVLKIDPEKITIRSGDSKKLTAVMDPADPGMTVEWSSSDTGIVKVDQNGVLTPVNVGKAFVKAKTNGLEARCEVTVEYTALEVTPSSISIYPGREASVSVSVPEDKTGEEIIWAEPQNASVASVSGNGKTAVVKGLNVGETNACVYIGNLHVGKFTISVKNEPEPTEVKEFTFKLKMNMDWDIADWGSSGVSEGDLRSGITLTGSGTNAGAALEDACDDAGIPNDFISTHDGNNNDLRYWVIQIFGLGTVPMENGDWKYWVQEHNGEYNQKTLGWYTDNSGVYSLRYDITSVDYGNDVKSIYVKERPDKTDYRVGESFDPAGMVVMADMSVGEDLQVYKYDVSPKTFNVAGEQKVTLTYRGHTTTVDVEVFEVPELVSIEVTELPDRTHYYVGEKLDPEGMVVTATMSDGTKTAVDAKVPETVFTSAGEQTVTVSYLDKTATFKVTVENYQTPEPDEDDVDKVVNPDGSTTTTTVIDKTDSNGNTVKSEEKVTVQEDGSSKGTKTETITDKNGNVTERNTVTETDKDGNVKSESNTTITRNDGTTVDTKEVVEKDKDGSVKTTESTVTSGDKVTESKTTVKADANGNTTGTQTESKTTETLKDADGNKTGTMETEIKETVGKDGKSEREESVVAESDDGNVKTETTSKTDKDGNVTAESKTTVKSESKDVGADVIDAALKQSEQTLSNVTADNKKVDKTVEVEVANGTSASLSPEAVKKVSDYGAGLKVSVKEGSIDTDSDVLKNLAGDGTKSVELSMEANNKDVLKDKQKNIVGDNHFVDLNALVGGENVHQLGGKAIITFGYQLKDGESAVDLKVFYVDDEGNKTLIDATFANGSFTMTVDHFSVYMVENTAAPEPVEPDTPEDDKDEGGISPVLIAGILVVIIAAIVGVVLYTRKN